MPGHYENWLVVHIVLEEIEFAPLIDVAYVTSKIMSCKFHDKASRNEVLKLIYGLGSTEVVTRTKRFPDAFLVNLTHGEFAEQLINVRLILEFDEQQLSEEKKMERRNSYYSSSQRLRTMLCNLKLYQDLYDRASFERRSQLVWRELLMDDETWERIVAANLGINYEEARGH
ncbi:uncharacterized protein LOC116414078 [Apis florea]|uniref:uncharacterized protein LOC116414078 n=1 Tax=Apis florea TaxID=7463 RepID=UPI0012FEA907|nr:uncharacterized protein LOC116414078 [Apis florea]XP_031771389.1 uncharacterized protein LOC116414078 [Apis florea]